MWCSAHPCRPQVSSTAACRTSARPLDLSCDMRRQCVWCSARPCRLSWPQVYSTATCRASATFLSRLLLWLLSSAACCKTLTGCHRPHQLILAVLASAVNYCFARAQAFLLLCMAQVRSRRRQKTAQATVVEMFDQITRSALQQKPGPSSVPQSIQKVLSTEAIEQINLLHAAGPAGSAEAAFIMLKVGNKLRSGELVNPNGFVHSAVNNAFKSLVPRRGWAE